jgi:transcriptional regulator with GAF, ATPase, and Fis domain
MVFPPLFSVNMLGFLLYDEQRRSLEAQSPFFGLSSQFVDIYKVVIRPNDEAEKIISKHEILSTADASSDPIWKELGLQDMAQAASMRDTTLVPLVSTGRFLGYLQLSNRKEGYSSLNPDELQLLNLVANQVASIIDNALLVHQARQRNQRSEALRRLASLVSSSLRLMKFCVLPFRKPRSYCKPIWRLFSCWMKMMASCAPISTRFTGWILNKLLP